MHRFLALLLFAFSAVALAQAPRQGADGFRNSYPHPDKPSFLAWQWERLRDGLPQPPPGGWNLPAMQTDPAALGAPGNNPSVTWVGHATMLVRLAGKNLLFDPIFSDRASPVGFAGSRRIVV